MPAPSAGEYVKTRNIPTMHTTEYIDHIRHSGVVEAVDNARRTVLVKLDEEGECGACPAARLCSASRDDGARSIEIPTQRPERFRRGMEVEVIGTEQMHRKAIMLATVLPCIALVAVMVAIYALTGSQPASALGGLGATMFFFTLLYLCRNRIAHEFNFTIEPLRRSE